MERVCQDLLDELGKYLGADVSTEDEKIWRYNMEMKMRRARSLWGNGGLLNDEAGLFTRESEIIQGGGFRDQICFSNDGEHVVLAAAKYTRFPAPPLHEFEAGGERERPLFRALLDYAQAAQQSGQRPIGLVYIHLTNSPEEFPQGFINGVVKRVLDFGQHAHLINAELLVLSVADRVLDLDPNISAREKILLARRAGGQRFFIDADRDEFVEHFLHSEFGKQWAKGSAQA